MPASNRNSGAAQAGDEQEPNTWPGARRRRPTDGSPCELCGVAHPLSFHHLIPRRNHAKTWFRDTFGVQEMRQRGAWLCLRCHRFIHTQFDEGTLGRRLNSLSALRAEPEIARYLVWAVRQKASR